VQQTFSLALALISKIREYDQYVQQGLCESSPIFTCLDYPITEISNKKWWIIGLGTIGKRVASVANAFGCDVSYYSTSGKNKNADLKQVNLESLLSQSDIISIHAPLNDQTINLLNKKNLKLIQDGAILLNLGRGGIINESDLVDVLVNKKLLVGQDVLEHEPIKLNAKIKEIIKYPNVIISPHIA